MKQIPVTEPVTASMVCDVTKHLPSQHVCALRLQAVSLSMYIVSIQTQISVVCDAYRDYNNYETVYLLPSSDSEYLHPDVWESGFLSEMKCFDLTFKLLEAAILRVLSSNLEKF